MCNKNEVSSLLNSETKIKGGFMRKIIRILGLTMVLIGILVAILTSTALAAADGSPGPELESGDGIAEGLDLEADGPNGYGPGPAPNSHDGIPDGPGW